MITPEMRERRGRWQAETTSPAICESDIRRWAAATYWPETPPRMFWDAEYAASGPWGGIVAPEEFNPFAWVVPRRMRAVGKSRAGPIIDSLGIPTLTADSDVLSEGEPRIGGMNAGKKDLFGERMRPGDVITQRQRLASWEQRETRLGPTMFVLVELEMTNQKNEVVRRREQSMLRYFHTAASAQR